jgi:hypothetical protein
MLTLCDVPRAPQPAPAAPHRPRSSRRWCDYFHRQWHRLLRIPWAKGAQLTPAERQLIAASLAEFQQGEGHDGGHFYRCASAHAQSTGDRDYAEAHRLFMAEEKRHARDLARLRLADIPLLTERSLLNRLFCWFGSRGGIELTVAIVAQIEVVGQVYYAALRCATGSAVLQRIAAQILRDEKQHVRFQAERLALIRSRRGPIGRALGHALDMLLFAGAALGCWWGHRHVLRAGGVGLSAFWRQARRKFQVFARQSRPHHYQFPVSPAHVPPYLGVAHAQ